MSSRAKFGIAVAIVLALGALVAWRIEAASADILTKRYPKPTHPLAAAVMPSGAANGARLARLNGCTGCHGEALTGHVVFTGPLGTQLVAPNLTTLVRHRSDEELAAAIRYGVKPDGTSLIDMPTKRFLRDSDSDIADIIAYLRSLPAKPDAAGDTQWRFDGKAMLALHLLPSDAAALDATTRGPRRTPTEPMALGRYITMAQCSGCHGSDLAGSPEEYSPDLRFSIKHYSLDVFERFFVTGEPRIGHGTRTMTPAIRHRLHDLTKDEVRAIYVYLNNSKAGE